MVAPVLYIEAVHEGGIKNAENKEICKNLKKVLDK